MNHVRPSPHYTPCADLWVITTYYNPAGYRTKRENYERFAAPIRAAEIPLITIESAFGAEPFELPPAADVIQVRGRDVLWLKERLINVAIAQLPPQAQKVAWLDNDFLFCNPDWAPQTAAALEQYPLVQPCASLHRLGRLANAYQGRGYFRRSFAYQWQHRPEQVFVCGGDHGFPGGAWAARRSIIEKHGLYDAAIIDGGDELFCHTLCGGFAAPCVCGIAGESRPGIELPWLVNRVRGRLVRLPWPAALSRWYMQRLVIELPLPATEKSFYAHYLRWAQAIYAEVRGQIGYVPGLALHLWHGNPANRQYSRRNEILRRYDFDPATDLRLNEQGVWEWASSKPELHQAVRDYFYIRKEDE